MNQKWHHEGSTLEDPLSSNLRPLYPESLARALTAYSPSLSYAALLALGLRVAVANRQSWLIPCNTLTDI